MFSKTEVRALIISILILGFAVGFDDKRDVFEWSYWLGNLLRVTFLVGISFLAMQLAHKIAARMSGFDAEYSSWGIQSFSLRPMSLMGRTRNKPFPRTVRLFGKDYLVKAFPIGLFLCLLTTVISNGTLFFLAVGQYTLLLKKASRLGRKFLEVTHYEEAKIALAGPMTNIVLMVLATFFNQYGTFDTFIFINAALALFHMLPISQLAGTKIYFGSRLLYVSSLIFMISIVVLAYTVSVIPMLVISLLSLFIGGSLYYYYSYFK